MDFEEVREACQNMLPGEKRTFLVSRVWGFPDMQKLTKQLEERDSSKKLVVVRRGYELDVSISQNEASMPFGFEEVFQACLRMAVGEERTFEVSYSWSSENISELRQRLRKEGVGEFTFTPGILLLSVRRFERPDFPGFPGWGSAYER
jgi:hypothetical protein